MFDLERDLAELYQKEIEISTELETLKYDFDNGTIDLEGYQDEKDFLKGKSQKLKGDIQDLENEFKRLFVAESLEEGKVTEENDDDLQKFLEEDDGSFLENWGD